MLVTVAALAGRDARAAISDQITIGNTRVVVRTVIGNFEGEIRTLALEDDVYHNELIATEKDSATKLTFLDETTLTLGPASSVVLDRFVFDPDPSRASFVMTAMQGIFRFASGKLPKNAYRLHTPAATIGIRGTVLDLAIEPAGRAGAARRGQDCAAGGRGHDRQLPWRGAGARGRPVDRTQLGSAGALPRPLRRDGADLAQGIDLRPSGRELSLAQAPFELGARLRCGLVRRRLVRRFGRETEPGVGERCVPRHAAAVPVHQAETGLRRNLPLLRRLPIPAGGGGIVTGDAFAPLVQEGQLILGIGQAPAGRARVPLRRQPGIARHPTPRRVEKPQIVLCDRVAPFGGLQQERRRRGVVPLDAQPIEVHEGQVDLADGKSRDRPPRRTSAPLRHRRGGRRGLRATRDRA